jgi:hypothetical protein
MRQLLSKLSAQESGQSAIIIAGALIVLIAAVALVVDGGNAYAQRRQLQNALDAGAQAGSIQMNLYKTNGQIQSAINEYLARNGSDPNLASSYYVTLNGTTKVVERGQKISQYNVNQYPPSTINGRPVYGLTVEGVKQFPTYFAGVVGWRNMQVGADSMRPAQIIAGPPTGTCQAEDIFPLTISANTFTDTNNDGILDINFMDTNPTASYRIWEKKLTEASNFGYVSWTGVTNSSTTVAGFMTDVTNSGRWSKSDQMPYADVNLNSTSIRNAIQGYITGQHAVTVPVYDYANGTSNYVVSGFARMTVIAMSASGASTGNRYIDVRFSRFVEPTGGGQCPYYGDASVVPPVSSVTRRLIGTVKLSKLNPVATTTQEETHVPVDVVNVLDISGSMLANFGSMTKLTAAKTALRNFNLNMQPLLGDKVGLATYPNITSGSSYSYNCQQNGSTSSYYVGQQRHTLTNNIAAVNSTINTLSANGGTPIAGGLQQGRLLALGAAHTLTSPAIIILASDGLANIRLNGKWTGFDGNAFNPPSSGCNNGAEQDAIDQANIAKGDNNNDGSPDTIIFTVAVGDDFNPNLLQAIATVDTDPSKPHYFRVTDASSMNSIYQQIANRVQNISSESCEVIQTEAFAPSAQLVIRNNTTSQSYTVTTTSTGEFVIDNVSPGTFEFRSATVSINGFTYNVFTDGVGGPALGSNPTVVVGQGAGTYKTDLFLKTTDAITCPSG